MSTELAPIVARLGSDTTGFNQGFDQAIQKTDGLEKKIKETEDAISELGENGVENIREVNEHVGFLHEAMEGFHEALTGMTKDFAIGELVAGGVEKAAAAIKEF